VVATRSLRGVVRHSGPLVVGLVVQAGTSYLTLILAGRLLGAAKFGGLSALYVLVTSLATGLFLPVEQEIARRRGRERAVGPADPTLARRAAILSLTATLALVLVALAIHPVMLKLLGGNGNLLASFSVALPGYACCFISRGVFAGTGELRRYGVQLGTEGVFRLVGLAALGIFGVHSLAAVGWLFGAAPWIALAASLAGRPPRPPSLSGPVSAGDPLLAALGLLLVSSLSSQLLVNAGPVVVQLLATPAESARAGAFLAALVVVRIPVFLFTAVQPSFLPAMAGHAAADRKADFVRLTRRVLIICTALTVVSALVITAVGPLLLPLLFGFHDGLSSLTFLAMGVAVGLFLQAAILAQALLGRGLHKLTTIGWLVGLIGLVAGTTLPGSAVHRATLGFLLGAVAAASAFSVLLAGALRAWPKLPDLEQLPAQVPRDENHH
jgi:O-antigen/teichoic acid export membrane protein